MKCLLLTSLSLAALAIQAPGQSDPLPDGANVSRQGNSRLPPILKVIPRRPPNPREPVAEIAAPIETFYRQLQKNNLDAAYQDLLAIGPLGKNKGAINSFVQNTESIIRIYGKTLEAELIDHYNVGSRLKVLTYFSHHSEKPIRWRFTWYRPQDRWLLMDLRVDDVLEDYLE